MLTELERKPGIIGPAVIPQEEAPMVRQERWEEIRRLGVEERVPIAEIARRLALDRKTVRRCLRGTAWRPYQRPARAETLLAPHAESLRARAPEVGYSAQILFQELRQHGYRGSYETVKRFVRPLRAARLSAERTLVRFETPPGQQSQIDWGTARVPFRRGAEVRHIFVLTLGFSRRSFSLPCLNETLPQFLDAHERAFEYFGGHTREHLYDRPRTVCQPSEGRICWNPTFKVFAEYWGFEPRLCQAYRAQTKGKVESGVKYFKGNFLLGRAFVDDMDLGEQLLQWMVEIADVRIHGTTHERPIERFAKERRHLLPTAGQPSFRLEARQTRIVVELRIVDAEGRDLPRGREGVLLTRGPFNFVGYLQGREFTGRCFREDEWFDTGDLAYFDKDGYLRITGRMKDVIVRGGENVPAKEIEDILVQHPKIREVAIVAMADARLGERACACIVPRHGQHVHLAELKEFLAGC